MNDEKYVIAEFKKEMVKRKADYMSGRDVLTILALIEAQTVLGWPDEPEAATCEVNSDLPFTEVE